MCPSNAFVLRLAGPSVLVPVRMRKFVNKCIESKCRKVSMAMTESRPDTITTRM